MPSGESAHPRAPLSNITNENYDINAADYKGKRRAASDYLEGDKKRIKSTNSSGQVCGNRQRCYAVEDVEMEDSFPDPKFSRAKPNTPFHQLRALRMGDPVYRTRLQLPTVSILKSFVSCNATDLFKCHSTSIDSFLTTPYACAYSNGSKLGRESCLAVGTEEGAVSIFNTTKREDWCQDNTRKAFQVHDNAIFDVKWSSSDKLIATASGDRSVRIIDPQSSSHRILRTFAAGHKSTVKCLAWDPLHDDLMASGGRDGSICLWDCRVAKGSGSAPTPAGGDESPVLVIPGAHATVPGKPDKKGRVILRPKTVTSLAYVLDRPSQIISGGAGNGYLRKWDMRCIPNRSSKTGRSIHFLDGSLEDLTTLPCDDRSMEVWSSPKRARGVCSIAIGHGPSAGRIFALCNDSRIHTYNAQGGAGARLDLPQEDVVYSHRHMATNSFYLRIAVSPCGRWLASGGTGGSAFLFDLDANTGDACGVEIKGQEEEISSVDWADNALATCADDGTVRIWRPDIERYNVCLDNPEQAKLDWSWGRV